jgi:valyl-tRNA synthetase
MRKMNKTVTEAFVRTWEMEIVYRANRLVNWSCSLKSAISDLEVKFEEFKGSTRKHIPVYPKSKTFEFGVLHKFAYKVADSDEEVIVATTRLETMLGDTAAAVHPTDPRYQHLIGKRLLHPFVISRSISIIGDPVLVDPKFGTGAVKVTPANDFNDYECGLRNHLEMVNILTDEGRINGNGGKYEGKLRFEVREEMEEDLKTMGLYRGKEDNAMKAGFCAKFGDAIEPYLKPQWYVRCKGLAGRAMASVTCKELRIILEF